VVPFPSESANSPQQQHQQLQQQPQHTSPRGNELAPVLPEAVFGESPDSGNCRVGRRKRSVRFLRDGSGITSPTSSGSPSPAHSQRRTISADFQVLVPGLEVLLPATPGGSRPVNSSPRATSLRANPSRKMGSAWADDGKNVNAMLLPGIIDRTAMEVPRPSAIAMKSPKARQTVSLDSRTPQQLTVPSATPRIHSSEGARRATSMFSVETPGKERRSSSKKVAARNSWNNPASAVERQPSGGLVRGSTIGQLQSWVPGTKAADTVRRRSSVRSNGSDVCGLPRSSVKGRVLRTGLVLAGRSMHTGDEAE